MSDVAIATDNLTKVYGRRHAVDRLTIEVRAGQVTGFVGPNGAGKTTTIRMLLGLIRPTSGTAQVLDRRLADAPSYLHRVGSLVDGPAFYPRLSGRSNLRVLARLATLDHRVPHVLEVVGLSDRADDPVATYSLGMRQRLGLAAALLPDPSLVILDEPANGLDPAGIRDIRRLLRRLADDGATVFVSSHQLSELQEVSDDVVLLRKGRLVYQGALAGLIAQNKARITVRPEDPEHLVVLERIARDNGWSAVVGQGTLVVGAQSGASGLLNRAAHGQGVTLTELSSRPPTLEEIFFALTEEEE
ncbi:ATP-binding cassette domain-containing protein [Promicromonospora sp. NPDC023987]|uniref:ABC transporter ATP-binding protein n=1 Tax=Promicromonospora sp. NPDC023987 TaxID=3155360 RepID=UPI0033F612ED